MSKAPTQVGTSTNTTTSQTTVPPYIQDAQRNLMSAAGNLTLPFTQYQPSSLVAGFTPDQEMAFNLARQSAQTAYGQQPLQVSGYGNPYTSAASAATAGSTAQQLGAGDISQFFNPYQQAVVGTTTQQLQEANDKQLAAIRARQGAEGAFGGNRGALETSEQNRNFGNTLAQAVAGLNQSGWQNAAQLGGANAQMRQQTALQNAANQLQTNLQNAGWQQQANLFNAQQPIQLAQAQNELNKTPWTEQMQALQMMLGTGGAQQDLAQKQIMQPYQALEMFRQTVPNAYGSSTQGTSSTPIYGPSTLQSLAPLLSIGAGLFGASDRTLKTDIQKLGKDEKTDLNMYAFRYKGDPKDIMKTVGPMAQDVEKKYPGSTVRIAGKLAIKPAARAMLGI